MYKLLEHTSLKYFFNSPKICELPARRIIYLAHSSATHPWHFLLRSTFSFQCKVYDGSLKRWHYQSDSSSYIYPYDVRTFPPSLPVSLPLSLSLYRSILSTILSSIVASTFADTRACPLCLWSIPAYINYPHYSSLKRIRSCATRSLLSFFQSDYTGAWRPE